MTAWRRFWAASAFLALACSTPGAEAGELVLEGPLVQGGLVIGQTEPGARVAVDGKGVRVSAGGRFLIGFGRDAESRIRLSVRHPDGSRTERNLAIKAREYPVQRIDGLPRKKVEPGPQELARIRDDNARIADVRRRDTAEPFFASGFMWPAEGPLTGLFGSRRILNGKPRRPHNGVDVAAPRGAPVVAAADGVVALAHPNMFFTGKTVMLDHGHGLTSVYVHMDEILVTPGERVSKGTPIGTVGMTGRVSGPHLHWGVSLFGTHLDPALLAGPGQHAGGR